MSIEQDAAQLLEDAYVAGRLPRKPSLATLARIAAVIAPVLVEKKTGPRMPTRTGREVTRNGRGTSATG